VRPCLFCALGALALLVAGCGGKSATTTVTVQAAAPTQTQQTTTQQTTTQATTTVQSTTVTDTQATSGQTTVLASANSTVDDDPARIEIVSLHRAGQVVEMTLRLVNLRPKSFDESMQVGNVFDDNLTYFNGTADPGDTLDGIYLVDGQLGKKYLVAHDSAGQPLTDTALGGTFIQPGQSAILSATLAAPPTTVTSIDVFIPHFGTLKGVPID
jgi:glucose/arabinose dehydrogenase